jgi:hypothetical protein
MVERVELANFNDVAALPSGHPSLVDQSLVGSFTHTSSTRDSGQQLRAWDANPLFAGYVFDLCGLTLDKTAPQEWRLEDEVAWVRVERASDGCFRLRVAGHDAPKPLAAVYAAAIHGHLHPLGRTELPTWKRRALLEAGCIDLPQIELAPLSEDADEPTHALWDGIALLLRVRNQRPIEPLPLARRFLQRWVPQSESDVRRGMEYLEPRYIWRAGSFTKPGRTRALTLWRVERFDEARP